MAPARHDALRHARALRDVRGGDCSRPRPVGRLRQRRSQGRRGGERSRRARRARPQPPPAGRGRPAGGGMRDALAELLRRSQAWLSQYPVGSPERCPSGLRSATGNRVGGVIPPRGFESHPLRSGRSGPRHATRLGLVSGWPPITEPELLDRLAMDDRQFEQFIRALVARVPPRAFEVASLERAVGYPWDATGGALPPTSAGVELLGDLEHGGTRAPSRGISL